MEQQMKTETNKKSSLSVAVVILNWNGRDLLREFLPSVLKYSDGANIYVADNASTDDSVAVLKKEFPEVTIIKNKENGGYAKGYNDALKHLEEDIFLLLNSDVEVTENWLGQLWKYSMKNLKPLRYSRNYWITKTGIILNTLEQQVVLLISWAIRIAAAAFLTIWKKTMANIMTIPMFSGQAEPVWQLESCPSTKQVLWMKPILHTRRK